MQPPRWHYRTVQVDVSGWLGPDVDTARLDAALDAYGAEGWELVSTVAVDAGGGATGALVAVFKRPR